MKNLNLSQFFLFIPLLCVGLSAAAQNNSLTAANGPVFKSAPQLVLTSTPVNSNAFSAEANLAVPLKGTAMSLKQAEGKTEGLSFGLELEALKPMGTFGDVTTVGAGVALRLMNHISENGALTGSVGYNYFLPSEDGDYKYSGIPVKLGYLHTFGAFFVEPQAGLYNLRLAFDDEPTVTSTNLVLSARAGVNLGEKSHLGVSYTYISASGGSLSFAGANLIFGF